MNQKRIFFCILFLGIFLLSISWLSAAQKKQVDVIKINDVITPAIADFISRSIEQATKNRAECLIIKMDTPGGLDTSMRDIIKDIMNADIPIVVYVAPSGARAASAGVFITLAADIAAMAPGTNIGAAHPVTVGGQQMDRKMREKVVNDAVAYIQSIAEKKGRNIDWAARAVLENLSIPETEALKKKIIDLVAKDLDHLLKKIDGQTVEKAGRTIKLATKGAEINILEMGFRERLLAVLSNPNIAYILMMIGLIGLYFELSNPGALFPGVIGGICLILAFFAFRMLPINYAGGLLILLGIFLFIAEIKVPSYGLLTIGGLVSLTLGSIMLFESPIPALRASFSVVIPTLIFTAAFFIFAVSLALKAQMARPATGAEGLIGETGVARTRLDPEGRVFVHGELWDAYSDPPVEEGEKVRVLQIDGLKLKMGREKEGS
ncbi:MAG: nodulation protein NfeD [Deltaproteobacteria bacterium]|nr:nodulation protein NfeD [Deltaproteobacteria bacterium]